MSKVHADCVEKTVGDTILFLHNSNENLAVFLIGRNWIYTLTLMTYANKVEGWKWIYYLDTFHYTLNEKLFLGDGIETYILIWTKPLLYLDV